MIINYKRFRGFTKEIKKKYETDGGLDLPLPEKVSIEGFETLAIPLGVGFEIPLGYIGYLVPRSSIAKKGLVIHPAIIDPGYTGEIHCIVTNASSKGYKFEEGDRMCSLVIIPAVNIELNEVLEFKPSERGENRFGSTGK